MISTQNLPYRFLVAVSSLLLIVAPVMATTCACDDLCSHQRPSLICQEPVQQDEDHSCCSNDEPQTSSHAEDTCHDSSVGCTCQSLTSTDQENLPTTSAHRGDKHTEQLDSLCKENNNYSNSSHQCSDSRPTFYTNETPHIHVPIYLQCEAFLI